MSDGPTIWQAPPPRQPKQLKDMTREELHQEVCDRYAAYQAAHRALKQLQANHETTDSRFVEEHIKSFGRDYKDTLLVYHARRDAFLAAERFHAIDVRPYKATT